MKKFAKLDSLIDSAKKRNIKLLIVDIDQFIEEFDLENNLATYFIENDALKGIADSLGKTENDVLNDDIYPSNGSIISGDFGELLYQLIYSKTHEIDFFHYRWRSKSDKDKSVPGSDLLGADFAIDADNPTEDDTLYVIEVKAGWVTKNESILQNGYDSLKKDQNGRVGKSLFAILKRMKQQDPDCDVSNISRFLNAQKNPKFKEQMIIGIGIKEDNWDDSYIKNLVTDKKFIPDDIIVLTLKDPWNKIKGLFKA